MERRILIATLGRPDFDFLLANKNLTIKECVVKKDYYLEMVVEEANAGRDPGG